MSDRIWVELLARAAQTLREHAGRATEGPWTYDSDDNSGAECIGAGDPDSPDVQMLYSHYDEDAGVALGVKDGSYVALMSPDVALPLAACLEKIAWMGRLDPDLLRRVGHEELIEVARAVLRDPAP
jgi:hypothetical protein